jgi:ABC-type antimicrobial peptide transport system permease subunit
VVQDVSRQFFVHRLETLNEQRDKLLFTHYTTAITTAVLAVLTFFLATIGLYGVLSYATKMRRFELGTRIAIGAKRKDIINLIIKDNAGAVGIGFVISLITLLGLAIGFSDALASYINLQLISLFSITLLLISVMSLFTCYWPLRAIINKPVIHSLRGSQ